MTPFAAGGHHRRRRGLAPRVTLGRPKPLVPVAGVPLIARVLANFEAAGIERVAIIFNENEADCARLRRGRASRRSCGRSCSGRRRHSLESFRRSSRCSPPGAPARRDGGYRVRAARTSRRSRAAAARAPEDETVLAVTPLVADEKPLWVGERRGGPRSAAIGGASGDAVTAGIYAFSERARATRRRRRRSGACASTSRGSATRGSRSRAVSIGKAVDVDRPEDVRLAESLLGGADGRCGRRRVSRPRCWGVYRELAHSPGRETDDALILRATAACARGSRLPGRAQLRRGAAGDDGRRGRAALSLRDVRAAGGGRAPRGLGAAGSPDRQPAAGDPQHRSGADPRPLRAPRDRVSRERPRRDGDGRARRPPRSRPSRSGSSAATCTRRRRATSSRADGPAELAAGARARSPRAASRARSLQEHVPGDLIKFYGVARGDRRRARRPGSSGSTTAIRCSRITRSTQDALRALVGRAAAALGLEVFGGDAIAGPDGRLVLIDLNAWPSFALYRDVAAPRIAAALAARFRREVGVPR